MKLQFDFEKVIPFKNVFEGPGYEKLKRSLLSILLGQKDRLFQTGTDPNGNTWAPLSQKAAKRKTKKNRLNAEELASKGEKYSAHKVLVDTGTLKNSLTVSNAAYGERSTDGNEISIGTNVSYARIHNFGGTIERKSNRQIKGKEETWAVNVGIPARPFIGFGKSDSEQISEKIEAFMSKGGLK